MPEECRREEPELDTHSRGSEDDRDGNEDNRDVRDSSTLSHNSNKDDGSSNIRRAGRHSTCRLNVHVCIEMLDTKREEEKVPLKGERLKLTLLFLFVTYFLIQ